MIQDKDPRGILQINISDVQAQFFSNVSNDVDGEFFVVQGTVQNRYKEIRNSISLKIQLISADGQLLRSEIIYAGNKLSDEQLKNLDIDSIRRLLTNKYGTDKNNAKVHPDHKIPFVAVFALDSMEGREPFSEFSVMPDGSFPGVAVIKQNVEE